MPRALTAQRSARFIITRTVGPAHGLPVRDGTPTAGLAAETADQRERLRFTRLGSKRLPPLAPPGCLPLAHPCSLQLGHDHGLFKLRHRAEDLANQRAGWVIVADRQLGSGVRSNDTHAQLATLVQDQLAHDQVTRQAVRAIHEHYAHPV
jgi:hypothetical protein